MIPEASLIELRQRHSIAEIAGRFGVRLRRAGRNLAGPCPVCSANAFSKTASRFEILEGGAKWACAVCAKGGDVIELVKQVQRMSLPQAVEWLGGAKQIDPATAKRLEAAAARRRQAREEREQEEREKERERLEELWRQAVPIESTLAEAYLVGRGLVGIRSPRLRFMPDVPYFLGQVIGDTGRREPRVVHRGPAMVAKMTRAGAFTGLHFTWIAADGRGKADIRDPDVTPTAEDPDLGKLSAKKMRGSKKGSYLALITPPEPTRLFMGEGIETVLSPAVGYRDRRPGDAFWSAMDLGNLGGPHKESVQHPTEKTANGRPRSVPGPHPDFTDPDAIEIPASVRELVLLGDSDSDPFLTRHAISRAAARYRRPGRVIRCAWPRPGADFNVLLQEATRAE